jgi:hypothetical protein
MNLEKLNEIIHFYSTYKFEDFKPIKINGCETVTDLRTFVRSHILAIRPNINNPIYQPYFDRLYKVYLISKI